MRSTRILPFLPYLILSIVHCVLVAAQLPGSGFETKQLLMPALALAVVWTLRGVAGVPKRAKLLVLAALTASWLGDGAGLFFPALPTLPTMILWFALAHIGYIVLFWRAPGMRPVARVPWWSLGYVLWWVATLSIVGPHAGALLVPLAVYGVVLGLTAALSPRLGRTVAFGGFFFLVSDTFLAFQEFMDMPQWISNLAVMPSYTLGQGLIVFGAVALLRKRVAHSSDVQPSYGILHA